MIIIFTKISMSADVPKSHVARLKLSSEFFHRRKRKSSPNTTSGSSESSSSDMGGNSENNNINKLPCRRRRRRCLPLFSVCLKAGGGIRERKQIRVREMERGPLKCVFVIKLFSSFFATYGK